MIQKKAGSLKIEKEIKKERDNERMKNKIVVPER
jgi:hypothetical protein